MNDNSLKALRWQCRRGMLELDVLLNRYLDDHYEKASPVAQATFRRMLKEPDPQLFQWLTGRVVPEDEGYQAIVKVLRA